MDYSSESKKSKQETNGSKEKRELDKKIALVKSQACKQLSEKSLFSMHKHFMGLCCLPNDTIGGLENMATCYSNLKNTDKDVTPLHAAILLEDFSICKQILSKKTDVNKGTLYGKSALSLALDQKNYNIAKLLIKKKADVNQVDSEGKAPMFYAIQKESPVSIVEDLLSAGVPKDGIIHVKKRRTPLTKAIDEENIPVLKFLLEKSVDVNPNTTGYANPLNVAIIKKSLEITELLVEYGASPEGRSNSDFFSPMIAVLYSQDMRFLEVLCTVVKDINKMFPPKVIGIPLKTCKETIVTSGTWLHMAVYLCNVEAVEVLLEKGADINIPEPYDLFSPLHAAARLSEANMTELKKSDYRRVIRLLLERGANVNATCKRGRTALEYLIAKRNWIAVKEFIKSGVDVNKEISFRLRLTPFQLFVTRNVKSLVELCLEYGADCSFAVDGMAPIHLALAQNDPLLVRTMLKHTVEVEGSVLMSHNIQDFSDETQTLLNAEVELAKAIEEGDEKKVKECMEKGAVPTGSLGGMNNPLHYACSKGFTKVALLLLENGAPPSQLNFDGFTPLCLAAEKGFAEICKALLRKGACYNTKGPKGVSPIIMVKSALKQEKHQVYMFSSNGTMQCDDNSWQKRTKKRHHKRRSFKQLFIGGYSNSKNTYHAANIINFDSVKVGRNDDKHSPPKYKIRRDTDNPHPSKLKKFTYVNDVSNGITLTNHLLGKGINLRCNVKAVKRSNSTELDKTKLPVIDLGLKVRDSEREILRPFPKLYFSTTSPERINGIQILGNPKVLTEAIYQKNPAETRPVILKCLEKEPHSSSTNCFCDSKIKNKNPRLGGMANFKTNNETDNIDEKRDTNENLICNSEADKSFELFSQSLKTPKTKNQVEKNIFKKFERLSINLSALDYETEPCNDTNSTQENERTKKKKTDTSFAGKFKVLDVDNVCLPPKKTGSEGNDEDCLSFGLTCQKQMEKTSLLEVEKLLKTVHKLFKMVEENNMNVLGKLRVVKNPSDVLSYINCINRKGNTLMGEALSLGHTVIASGLMSIRLQLE